MIRKIRSIFNRAHNSLDSGLWGKSGRFFEPKYHADYNSTQGSEEESGLHDSGIKLTLGRIQFYNPDGPCSVSIYEGQTIRVDASCQVWIDDNMLKNVWVGDCQ